VFRSRNLTVSLVNLQKHLYLYIHQVQLPDGPFHFICRLEIRSYFYNYHVLSEIQHFHCINRQQKGFNYNVWNVWKYQKSNQKPHYGIRIRVVVLIATFNNISVISERSVLLVEETGVSGQNHRLVARHWHNLSHNVVSSTYRLSGYRTHNVSGDRHWLSYDGERTSIKGTNNDLQN